MAPQHMQAMQPQLTPCRSFRRVMSGVKKRQGVLYRARGLAKHIALVFGHCELCSNLFVAHNDRKKRRRHCPIVDLPPCLLLPLPTNLVLPVHC